MTGYLLRRVLLALITILGVTLLVFAAVRVLPGNRVDVLLATGTNSGPDAKAKLEHELGFDRPFLVQYGHWLGSVATGDLGKSLVNGQSLSFYIK
jgi:peptide/nickel transport system permease protein